MLDNVVRYLFEILTRKGICMAAYAFVEITINNEEGMSDYREKVVQTVEDYQGTYLVRGGEIEILEGGIGEHPLKVLLEFPDMETARNWYNSDAYQNIIDGRIDNSEGNFLLLEGI